MLCRQNMNPARNNHRHLWKILCLIEGVLLLISLYMYYAKSLQYQGLSQPLIIETNLVVTNLTTNIDMVTNIIVQNAIITNAPREPAVLKPVTQPTNTVARAKVIVSGYNIALIKGAKYAHAVVRNVSPLPVKRVRITFNQFGTNRRGPFSIGNVVGSLSNLGPYRYGELRTVVDRRTIRIEIMEVNVED